MAQSINGIKVDSKSEVIIRVIRDGAPIQLVQPVSPTGIPLCLWCAKPVPKSERTTYRSIPGKPGQRERIDRERAYFCGITHAGYYGLWVAQKLYPVVGKPKICPICKDGACETSRWTVERDHSNDHHD